MVFFPKFGMANWATCACVTHVSSQRFDVNRIRKRCRISWVIMYKAVSHGLCMAMLVLDSFGAQFLVRVSLGPLHCQLMVGTKASIPKARLLAVEESGRLSKNGAHNGAPKMGSTGNVSGIRIKCIPSGELR